MSDGAVLHPPRSCFAEAPLPPTGSRLHCSGGRSGGPEAGTDQGREARPQLHDGHATLQKSE